MRRIYTRISLLALTLLLGLMAGCGGSKETASEGKGEGTEKSASGGGGLTGNITLDGSSTVAPISQAVAEEFNKANPNVKVPVGTSGTGGGFKKFVAKEIDIADASRPIEEKEEEEAKKNGVEYIELPIAYDGLSLVIHPKNTWADTLTVAELKKIWEPNSKIANWKDVRPGFPDKPLKLYGAGPDSGTFDYFTEAIVGKKRASRSDYQASEDDNTLVQGVSGDEGSLGYFGFAYFEENQDKLKLVGVDGGKGAVKPSAETISNATYQPLSRPLFLYIRKDAADRPEVQAFVKFYLTEGVKLVREAGYIPLPDKAYQIVLKRFEAKKTGSVFKGAQVGVKIEDLMAKEESQ